MFKFVIAFSVFVLVVVLIVGLSESEKRGKEVSTKTIGQMCTMQPPQVSAPVSAPDGAIDWYWTDDQSTPDSICAHMYTVEKLGDGTLKFAIEEIQPDGSVLFAAFSTKNQAIRYVEKLPYQRRTIIQDKRRSKGN